MLFNHSIHNLEDWGRLFQDKKVFKPLVEYIFQEHGIVFSGMEHCTPGSNAVFRTGKYIIKIFAPEESEIGKESDFVTEQFGIARANQLNIPAPRLLASGVIKDKYIFRYLVLAFIEGKSLTEISRGLSGEERMKIGQDLRKIVDRMDIPCETFNEHVLFGKSAEDRWKAFPAGFQKERKEYLKSQGIKTEVYVHGDLNPDNIIIDKNKEIRIIDFADALLAPMELELAAIICDGFRFNPDYLRGFLGKYDNRELAEKLLYGLLIHDYGVNIIRDNIGNPGDIFSLEELWDKLLKKIPVYNGPE